MARMRNQIRGTGRTRIGSLKLAFGSDSRGKRPDSSQSNVAPLLSFSVNQTLNWHFPTCSHCVPFALVKRSLDLDALRVEATGICRSKLRTVPISHGTDLHRPQALWLSRGLFPASHGS